MDLLIRKSQKQKTVKALRQHQNRDCFDSSLSRRRHGSERWANLAAFSEATDFRFRAIQELRLRQNTLLSVMESV